MPAICCSRLVSGQVNISHAMGDIMGADVVPAEEELTLEDCVKKCEVEWGGVVILFNIHYSGNTWGYRTEHEIFEHQCGGDLHVF